MIIHIAGASGSGKTTLGNKLKEKFGKKIVVKDLDDTRDDFIKFHINKNTSCATFEKNFVKNYQLFLDEYINRQTKPLVLVGINTFINDESFVFKHKEFDVSYCLDTHADYKLYIDLPTDIILTQRWNRQYNAYIANICKTLKKSKDVLLDVYMTDPNINVFKINADLAFMLDYKLHVKHIKNWDKFYKDQKYVFMSQNDIFNFCSDLI